MLSWQAMPLIVSCCINMLIFCINIHSHSRKVFHSHSSLLLTRLSIITSVTSSFVWPHLLCRRRLHVHHLWRAHGRAAGTCYRCAHMPAFFFFFLALFYLSLSLFLFPFIIWLVRTFSFADVALFFFFFFLFKNRHFQ